MIHPLKVKLSDANNLRIEWDDNSHSSFDLMMLRRFCPCATCIADRTKQSKNYIPIFSREQITLVEIKTIGNYAIGIKWKDGHNTGIYEYRFLYKLAGKNKVTGK